jgi:hypothetical protein
MKEIQKGFLAYKKSFDMCSYLLNDFFYSRMVFNSVGIEICYMILQVRIDADHAMQEELACVTVSSSSFYPVTAYAAVDAENPSQANIRLWH